MSLARGTIVYGDDPFKGEAASRPWVVISSPTMPFHGEQYIVLTLTTKTWYEERILIDDSDIVDEGFRTTVLYFLGPFPPLIPSISTVNLQSSTKVSSTTPVIRLESTRNSVVKSTANWPTPSVLLSLEKVLKVSLSHPTVSSVSGVSRP